MGSSCLAHDTRHHPKLSRAAPPASMAAGTVLGRGQSTLLSCPVTVPSPQCSKQEPEPQSHNRAAPQKGVGGLRYARSLSWSCQLPNPLDFLNEVMTEHLLVLRSHA